MLYLGNASSERVRDAMRTGLLGQMCTPAEGRQPLTAHDDEPVWFAADNGCYGGRFPGADRWLAWLTKLVAGREHRCLFAVAPDIFQPDLGDRMGWTSLMWSRRFLGDIRSLGVPAAIVAQNGLTPELLAPYWGEFDVLFIGGTTEWKIGPHAHRLAIAAKERGMFVHMGRVNSARRWRRAEVFECDSCDGTFLAFGPDTNLPRLAAWPDLNLFTTDGAA